MALSNRDRIDKNLHFLVAGLAPYVERELKRVHGEEWPSKVDSLQRANRGKQTPELEASNLLAVMWDEWNRGFSEKLGHAERSLVSEIRNVRNEWAHQKQFSTDDTYRALDSIARLLNSVSSPEAEEVEKQREEVLRVKFE